MQILFSNSIPETDLLQLEELISIHLKSILDVFGGRLQPKRHFLTHYPSVIRLMGPPKCFWMMRFESKHKFFTQFSKKSNNFKNLTKSLADRHQDIMINKNPNYGDDINEAKLKKKITFDIEKTIFHSTIQYPILVSIPVSRISMKLIFSHAMD